MQGESADEDVEKTALKQVRAMVCSCKVAFKLVHHALDQVLQKSLSRQLEESFITLTSAAKDGDADMVSFAVLV